MIVNQAALAQLKIGYSAAFNKGFEGMPERYTKIATAVPSATAQQAYPWLGQLPGLREWVGEREIQKLEAYDYIIKNKKFEMTIGVKRDDIEDDTYGVYTPLFQNMGEAAKTHPDELCFQALLDGFDKKCYDGEKFFSDQHKSGGAAVSNLGTAALSDESYNAARTSMMSIKGEKGRSLKIIPDLLVIPPQLEHQARLLLKADEIQGTTNVNKDSADLLVVPELAVMPDAWFLMCTSRFLKPLIYQIRKKIKFTSLTNETDENVFMRDEYIYGADGRSNTGYGFWQMIYASDGTIKG